MMNLVNKTLMNYLFLNQEVFLHLYYPHLKMINCISAKRTSSLWMHSEDEPLRARSDGEGLTTGKGAEELVQVVQSEGGILTVEDLASAISQVYPDLELVYVNQDTRLRNLLA